MVSYVLQWVGLTGNSPDTYFSCAKLGITGGLPDMTCPPPPSIPTQTCTRVLGPDVAVLLNGATPGAFCYDSAGVYISLILGW